MKGVLSPIDFEVLIPFVHELLFSGEPIQWVGPWFIEYDPHSGIKEGTVSSFFELLLYAAEIGFG